MYTYVTLLAAPPWRGRRGSASSVWRLRRSPAPGSSATSSPSASVARRAPGGAAAAGGVAAAAAAASAARAVAWTELAGCAWQ